jgi:beta-glucosidase
MASSLMESSRSFRFPDGFLWGAATAGHQVEGGNRRNDWWA